MILTFVAAAFVAIVIVAERMSRESVLDDAAHDFAGQDTQARIARIHRSWFYTAAGVAAAMLLLGIWGGGVIFCSCEVM